MGFVSVLEAAPAAAALSLGASPSPIQAGGNAFCGGPGQSPGQESPDSGDWAGGQGQVLRDLSVSRPLCLE